MISMPARLSARWPRRAWCSGTVVARERAGAGCQHGGVQVGEDVFHAAELLAQLARGLARQDRIVREVEFAHGSLSRDADSSSP